MDQTKIVKMLRLMKLLTGNVNWTIDQIAKELSVTSRTVYRYIDDVREAGFVVNKLYGNVYAMGKVARGLSDFNKLIYFTEEDTYNNIAGECQPLLRLQELLLEARAATEGYDGVFAGHKIHKFNYSIDVETKPIMLIGWGVPPILSIMRLIYDSDQKGWTITISFPSELMACSVPSTVVTIYPRLFNIEFMVVLK